MVKPSSKAPPQHENMQETAVHKTWSAEAAGAVMHSQPWVAKAQQLQGLQINWSAGTQQLAAAQPIYSALSLTLSQAEQQRELSAVAAAEADALAAALSRKMQMQEASSKEVQRLREESAELRE